MCEDVGSVSAGEVTAAVGSEGFDTGTSSSASIPSSSRAYPILVALLFFLTPLEVDATFPSLISWGVFTSTVFSPSGFGLDKKSGIAEEEEGED